MKKTYDSPNLEIVETMERYCVVDLTTSSESLGDSSGGGNEDLN